MKVVVAVDGSYIALHALRASLELLRELAAPPEVVLAAVVDDADLPDAGKSQPEISSVLASEAETALAAATELCNQFAITPQQIVLHGHVVDEVMQLAQRTNANLIVVGTHGRKGIQRAVLGSTCEGLIRRSDIPVLAIRQPAP